MPGAKRLRPIGYEEQLTVVGHLDELRTRIIVSLLAFAVAFGICFWQNPQLLKLINGPLAHQTQQQVRHGHGPLGATYVVSQSARDVALQLQAVDRLLAGSPAGQRRSATASELQRVDASLQHDVARLSAAPQGDKPVTLGIGEPFTTTITVSAIFALILALPVLLAQIYAFFMPALEESRRRQMLPVAIASPLLFIIGVAFGYFVVLPAAVHFLQNFNSDQFNVLVQASQYYRFAATTILAMGLVFELPVAILAVTRAGIVSAKQLRRNRRYAVAACALVAAVLPGDAVTMLLETAPLYALFELSLLIASVVERRAASRGHALAQTAA